MSSLDAHPVDHVGLVHGPAARLALETAAGELGGRLASTSVRSVDHVPGQGATAVHDVVVVGPDERPQPHVLALTTDVDTVVGSTGTLVLASDDVRLGVWRLPFDPALPGLVPCLDTGAVAGLLAACGVPVDPDDVAVSLRAYRPRRRAVVEVTAPGASLFLKVVPPSEARALHERHRLLAAAGVPAPRSLGVDPRGVVVLTRLPGTTWRSAMGAGSPGPGADELWRAMDRLPPELLGAERRPSWAEQSWHHVALLHEALPEHAGLVDAVAAEADVRSEVAGTPLVPVHGDLYEAQVMVGPTGRLTGVLDLDTSGPGHRVDDEACLAAHLGLLPVARPGLEAACVAAWHEQLLRAPDPDLVWRRSALVLLTLATGPTRTRRSGWQRTALRWLTLPRLVLDSADGRPWERGADALARLVAAARAA